MAASWRSIKGKQAVKLAQQISLDGIKALRGWRAYQREKLPEGVTRKNFRRYKRENELIFYAGDHVIMTKCIKNILWFVRCVWCMDLMRVSKESSAQ